MHLTDDYFEIIRDFIYEHSGLHFHEKKKYLIQNRVGTRVTALGMDSFEEYTQFLHSPEGIEKELFALFDEVTTSETSFFREPAILQAFQHHILIDILQREGSNSLNSLRFLSAGCASGEEPYTIAMLLMESLGGELRDWYARIFAMDISPRAIATAQKCVWDKHSLRNTPDELRRKYFVECEDGVTFNPRVEHKLKSLVTTQSGNLFNQDYLDSLGPLHVVFCRNVLIYFDDDSKERLVNLFYERLLPDGYLVLGHSESLYGINSPFRPIGLSDVTVYQKD